MLKRFSVALAALFVLATQSFAAGTIPYSLSQQFDKFGHVLAGCKLNIIQAGTVGTPQIAYQDTALTIPVPGGSQLVCDAAGRLPQFFLADGNIKIQLTDANGALQVIADNILVIGNSSGGGGGGSPVDPTTVLTTGDIKATYGTGIVTGFVRLNGRTIGSATSGATERANSDTQALFQYLWNTDPNLVVSTGRGASANADWVANKQLTLPDATGRVLANIDPSGSILNSFTMLPDGSTLGAKGGFQASSLVQANLPSVNFTVSGSASVTSNASNVITGGITTFSNGTGASNRGIDFTSGAGQITSSGSISGSAASGGSSSPFNNTQPTILVTYYIKL